MILRGGHNSSVSVKWTKNLTKTSEADNLKNLKVLSLTKARETGEERLDFPTRMQRAQIPQ